MRRIRKLRSAAATVLLLCVASCPCVAQQALGINEYQNASAFRQEPGRRLTFVCQASDGTKATIYGTDTYTDDSAICAAAIHAGVLKAGQTGEVRIVIGSGAPSFEGTERNGVTSRRYGRWEYSYTFAGDAKPGTVSWWTVWNEMPADYTSPVTVTCPAEGNVDATVWGTDIYSGGSAICVAAVHAGVITSDRGGVVTVTRAKGQDAFPGSDRNRVASRRWGAYADAFTVAAASVSESAAGTPVRAVPGPRTIMTAGFAGSGVTASAAVPVNVAPRTLQTSGFTGSGLSTTATGPAVAPRTINTAGWTASSITPGA